MCFFGGPLCASKPPKRTKSTFLEPPTDSEWGVAGAKHLRHCLDGAHGGLEQGSHKPSNLGAIDLRWAGSVYFFFWSFCFFSSISNKQGCTQAWRSLMVGLVFPVDTAFNGHQNMNTRDTNRSMTKEMQNPVHFSSQL